MRKQDIVKGGVYWDGNMGVRKILDIGPQYRQYSHRVDRDCVQFQVLSDSKHGLRRSTFDEESIKTSARQSFANWATQRIDVEATLFHDVMESVNAGSLRLRQVAADAILSLAKGSTGEKLQIRPIKHAEVDTDVMQQLERMGLIVATGDRDGASEMTFTSLGAKVVSRLKQAEEKSF